MRFGTLFSGGEGVGVGLTAAGLHHVWGIEFDADIAAVAADNGFAVHVADVRQVDYAALPAVDWLHASPVCTRASVANSGAVESQEDIDTAAAVVRALKAQSPQVFTLENVWQYRTFKAFTSITDALGAMGYFWTYDHCNSADFGGETKCPLHVLQHMTGSVHSAANSLSRDFLPRTAAPDIAQAIAMMQSGDRAWHLAWDAVAHLVRVTQQDIAANATFRKLVSELEASAALKTTNGREAFMLTSADMFVSASTGSIGVNIAWLLNLCLDAPLLRERLSTISTGTLRTMTRLILSCLLTTVSTSPSTTRNHIQAIHDGESGTSGTVNNCPLCHVTAVPQTRRRLILRASRGLLPWLPEPVPWVGWYAAIEDLIPTLPESKLAPWQLARLPEELRETVLVGGGNTQLAQVDSKSRAWHEPMFTVTGNTKMGDNRAVLVSNAKTEYGDGMAQGTDPAWSVTSQTVGRGRAVLIAKTADKFGDGHRQWSEPAQTIGANEHGSKAVLVAGLLNSESTTLTQRDGDEPAFTVPTSHNQRDARAWTGARVVSMTPRCLARFQSVPDTYRLPAKRTLAARVIGNMVPPLLMQRIAEGLTA